MVKTTEWVCQECGYESAKWLGKCPGCGGWNTFKEVKPIKEGVKTWLREEKKQLTLLNEVPQEQFFRTVTNIQELDRVLGGGIASGSLVLIGGDPGIGKSTLILEIATSLAKNRRVLYVSAEESLEQLRERANRLQLEIGSLYGFEEANLEEIIRTAEELAPDFLFIDSIQTIYHPDIPASPGSLNQVRECGAELLRFTKKKHLATFIVGHVTKDGSLAGPKTLEHMVDVVLYLEGETRMGLRILRSSKNRFGGTHEIGVFEMREDGMVEVKNPSLLFLSHREEEKIGVTIAPVLEGERPILVELQALVATPPFATPQRNATGIDQKRLAMILAVLEKQGGILTRNKDVFINVQGGLRIEESGIDLALSVALASAARKHPLPANIVFIGELDLSGGIRPVRGISLRLQEAERLGFKCAYLPARGGENVKSKLELVKVNQLKEVMKQCRM